MFPTTTTGVCKAAQRWCARCPVAGECAEAGAAESLGVWAASPGIANV